MSDEMSLKCSVCRRVFTGTSKYLRETIWPHAETHTKHKTVSFSSTFILSCNCGECDFCKEKARGRAS